MKSFCRGCMHEYEQAHLLRKHRRDAQCGGRFMTEEIAVEIQVEERASRKLQEVLRITRLPR